MTLYIFEPHDKWAYCGGVLVILAKSFVQCEELVKEWLKKNHDEYEAAHVSEDKRRPFVLEEHWGTGDSRTQLLLRRHADKILKWHECDKWVLTHTFNTDDYVARIVTWNYNHG